MTDACIPHPAELTKRERIEEESRLKGEDPAEHLGWGWWLCRTCGTWHRAENIPTSV